MAKKARLDADKTAKPKTRLVGHVPAGHCVGPSTSTLDLYLEACDTLARTKIQGPK